MYFEHFHLEKKPFGLTPGPDFFWLSENHKEALATLRYGVIGDLGFLLLTGEVGVGKTALIHRLVTSLDSSTIVAHITDPGLGINDFFRLLAVEFGIDTPFSSKGEFLIILERFLRQADKEEKKVLLIVDEAQRLNNVLLDEIRVLSNIELNDRKLINIFFIGQPEFKKLLLAANNRPIRQRIAIYHHVNPLTETETGQYIAHRLKIAGAKQEIFKPDAIREIHRISKGYPRAINILCDHALLTGFASGVQTIDAEIVRECENELNIDADVAEIDVPTHSPTPPPEFNPAPRKKDPEPAPANDPPPVQRSNTWAYPAVIAAGIVLVMLAGYYFLMPDSGGTRPMQKASGTAAHRISNAPVETEAPRHPLPATETPLARDESPEENRRIPERKPTVTRPETPSEPMAGLIVPTPPPDLDLPAPGTVAGEADRPVGSQFPSGKSLSPDSKSPAAIADGPDDQPALAEQPDAPAFAAGSPAADSTLLANAGSQPAAREKIPQTEAPEEVSPEQPAATPRSQPAASPSPFNPPAEDPAANRPAAAAGQPSSPAAQLPAKQAETAAADTTNAAEAAISEPAAEDPTPVKESTTPEAKADASSAQPAAPLPPAEGPAPENTPSAGSSEPAIPDTAALAPQTGGNDAAGDATPAASDTMEGRLRSFLKAYCTTYAAKDLDSFTDFFASDAIENGKPFQSLLPKYQRNFTFIDTIYYRIELQDVTPSEDGEMVKIDGNFFLRWLPPDKKWRENAGKIQMTLEEKGSSFLVHRLDYHSNRAEEN